MAEPIVTGQAVNGGNTQTAEPNGAGQNTMPLAGEKTFTQAELDARIQSESDRRVQQARQKWEADKAAELEAAKSEGAKLAAMTEKQRAEAEAKAEREKYEREKVIFEKEKLTYETSKILSNKNLPIEFAEILAVKDADTTAENVEKFSKAWSLAIQKAVDERLKGGTPNTGKSSATITKDEIFKIKDASERQKMIAEHPDLFGI